MSKTDFTVQDEALDAATAADYLPCMLPCRPCYVSDEALDAPEHLASPCGSPYPVGFCYSPISDEALDVTEQHATNGGPGSFPCAVTVPCRVSDEALDAATADVYPCTMPCTICRVSDEALDAAATIINPCGGYCGGSCRVGDEVHATR